MKNETARREIESLDYYLQNHTDDYSEESHTAMMMGIKALEQKPVLDKIRAEIEQKIEQERFARSVFRGEEKDTVKAEQCTGSIFAYNNVIKLIDKYKEKSDEKVYRTD